MGYQFEHSWKHERERLAAIEGGLDAYTMGAGSIARWLCERVAPSGSVVATDLETGFLEKLVEHVSSLELDAPPK